MSKSHFAPDSFEVTTDRLQWAVTTFNISEDEVLRQTVLWHEHEYKRAYFDWNRAWKRWFRQAEKYDELRRDRTYSHYVPEVQSAEEKRKGDEQLRELGKMAHNALKVVAK